MNMPNKIKYRGATYVKADAGGTPIKTLLQNAYGAFLKEAAGQITQIARGHQEMIDLQPLPGSPHILQIVYKGQDSRDMDLLFSAFVIPTEDGKFQMDWEADSVFMGGKKGGTSPPMTGDAMTPSVVTKAFQGLFG